MVLKRLLGSTATRSLTVVSVLSAARTAFSNGKRIRAIALLGVAVLAWKWMIIGLAAQGLLKLISGGKSSASQSA